MSNVFARTSRPDRAAAADRPQTATTPIKFPSGQTPSFAALPKAHVFTRFSVAVNSIDRRQRMRTGPARADMGSLHEICRRRDPTRSIARDDGATSVRIRPRSANGLHAMRVGVVFAGCTLPPDGLSKPHPYPAAEPPARSGRDAVGVVCLCLGSGGSPRAAMVPILRVSVGGYRPQIPVKESMRLRSHAPLSVLAKLAEDDETARRNDDMGHLAWVKVVDIGHNIALRSQLEKVGHSRR